MASHSSLPERRIAFRRTIATYLRLGVTRDQVAEVIQSLQSGTDPDELRKALDQYVPIEDAFEKAVYGEPLKELAEAA